MKPLAAQTISGTLIAEYPDFAPGTPVRVLPAIVSNNFPTDGRIIDDAWSFAGPTRHPEYAVIRHDRDHITVTMQRHRLQQRPPSRRPAVLSLARVTHHRGSADAHHRLRAGLRLRRPSRHHHPTASNSSTAQRR